MIRIISELTSIVIMVIIIFQYMSLFFEIAGTGIQSVKWLLVKLIPVFGIFIKRKQK